MKATKFIALFIALFTMASCEKLTIEDSFSQQEILLSAEMSSQAETRTTSQAHLSNDALHFAEDQHVAVYIIDHARNTSAAYQGDLHTMTTAAGDVLNFDVGSHCYWPGDNAVDFYAWYPYVNNGPFTSKTSNDNTVFTISTNQKTAAAYAANDLMFAKSENQTRPAVAGTRKNLIFQHALSQVIVILQSAESEVISDEQLASATVTISGTEGDPIYMDANVDIDGGTAPALTTGTTATEVELGTGATTFAVLPSGQSLTGKVINFQLEGGGTQHYTISTIGTLVAGRKYTITLSLKLNVITTVTETVVDWVDGGDNRDATGNPLYI